MGIQYFFNFFLIIEIILILTCIAYCLHFVDIIVVNNVIKCGVELVEEVDHLVGSAGTRQQSKANDITVAEE